MENLIGDFDKSFQITLEEQRKKQYKSSSIGDTEDHRAKRRDKFLEESKKKRSNLVNEARGLLNDNFAENYGDEEWMDWSEVKKKGSHRKWLNPQCKNQLMLSEWLIDRPADIETDWTCVLCPKGRRCLVVAKMGFTKSYLKNGVLSAKFKSILPNGAPTNRSKNSDVIILDCVWVATTKQLYALDVLYWRNQPLLDSDAQFRLYWLKSKLSEVKASSPTPKPWDMFDVHLPPHCSFSQLTETLSAQDHSQVDGILFYHNGAPYVPGQTPLVGWLKPFMLYERFRLNVPEEYMAYQPDNYEDLEQWVSIVSHVHHKDLQRGKKVAPKQEDMDSSNAFGYFDASVEGMEETEDSEDSSLPT